jgi:hypothetical protein
MQAVKIIWQVKDGKRGHENQSGGLIRALKKLHNADCVELPLDFYHASWPRAIFGKLPNTEQLPSPDLIIGCGSRTHSTLLSAGRTTGAPTILIMAPPRGLSGLFSLCIIPEHDSRSGKNIIVTKGAMNLIQANKAKERDCGLILIGGPSQHHDWDSAQLLEQIDAALAASPGIDWVATTSRRTPPQTTKSLTERAGDRLKLVPCEETDVDWLRKQLSRACYVWVTEDSVSMVYEALSSGAKVGLLPIPRKKQSSRVLKSVDQLKSEGTVLPFQANTCDLATFSAPPRLNEAERVAQIVAERLSWV